MYCPRCEKEFAGSIRLCPECFGDLEQSAGLLPGPTYQVPAPQTYEALKQQAAPLPPQPMLPTGQPAYPNAPAPPMQAPQGTPLAGPTFPLAGLQVPPVAPPLPLAGPPAGHQIPPTGPQIPLPGPATAPQIPGGNRVTITSGSAKAGSPLPGVLIAAVFLVVCLGLGLFLLRGRAPDAGTPAASASKGPNPVAVQDALNQARELYDAGEYEAAAELGKGALDGLLEGGASDSEEVLAAREFVGTACYKAKQHDEAVKQYQALVQARPNEARYSTTRDTMVAEQKKHNREVAMERLEEGRTQLSSGSLIKAIQLGEQAVALLRSNDGTKQQMAAVHRLIGKAHYKKGDWESAADHLRQAIKYEPDQESKSLLASLEGQSTVAPEPAPRPAAASQPPDYASAEEPPPSRSTTYSSGSSTKSPPKPSYPKGRKKSYYPSYSSSSYSSSSSRPKSSYSSLGKGSTNSSNSSSSSSSSSSSYSSGSSSYKPSSRVSDMRRGESLLGRPGPDYR